MSERLTEDDLRWALDRMREAPRNGEWLMHPAAVEHMERLRAWLKKPWWYRWTHDIDGRFAPFYPLRSRNATTD